MLILISAYFALEGCFHFGDIYHLILKFKTLQEGFVTSKVPTLSQKFKQRRHLRYCERAVRIFSRTDSASESASTSCRDQVCVYYVYCEYLHCPHGPVKKKLKTCLSLSMYLLLYSCALPVIYNLVISKGNQETKIKLKYINTSRCGLTKHQTNIMLEAKENRMNS